MVTITEPRLVPDLDEVDYHADPVPKDIGGSLSQSGAKLLIPPSTPAHFRWSQDHPQAYKRQFAVGKAVHCKVQGVQAPVEVVQAKNKKGEPYDARDYATVSAQQHRDEIHERGLIPLLRSEFDECEAMAEAVLAHPLASVLFEQGYGTPEVSAFWRDPETNVMLRCRYDWLPDERGGRVIVPDLKTARSANPDTFGKSAADFGYFMQDPHYLDGLAAHGIGNRDNAFIFVLVEKTPPYLVSVVQLTEEDRALGRRLMRRAIDTYARCMEADEWPGYTTEVASVSLPYWFHRLHEEVPA